MSWSLVPAAKITRKASLVVGLSGLSGSGKTFSALLLAKALARGGKVVGICTENNRMADYQDQGLYPGLESLRDVRGRIRAALFIRALYRGNYGR